MNEGLEEDTLRGDGETGAIDRVGVEADIAEDMWCIDGEISCEGGIGPKGAIGGGDRG